MGHFKFFDKQNQQLADKFKNILKPMVRLSITIILFLALIQWSPQFDGVQATPSPTRLPGAISLDEQRSQIYQQQQLYRQSATGRLTEQTNLQQQHQQPKQIVSINTANNQNFNINLNNNNNNNNINNLNNPYTNATYTLLLDLRQQLLVRALKFDENFRTLLSKSKQSLHNLFMDTYGMIYQQNTEIFTSMYEGLEQYYATGRIPLTKSMESFFERLYLKIFQIYNQPKVFTQGYLECATEQLVQLKPFKDAPDKLITDIRHAFVAARTFNQALNSGMDVIKGIISLGQPPQCTNLIGEKLLKFARPCLDHCEQVISRCIGRTNLETLNDKWRAYVNSLSELAKKLSNIQTIIGPMEVQISEAIMNFQDNGGNITAQVYHHCGQPPTPGGHAGIVAGAGDLGGQAVVGQASKVAQLNNRLGKRAAGSQQLLAASRATGSQQPPRQPAPPQMTLQPPPPPIASPQLYDERHALALGKEAPIIINEVRDFMLSNKNFWSNLPNAVCARTNLTLPPSGNPASYQQLNQRSRQQQQQQQVATGKCFSELLGFGDMNLDIRYRNEIQRQAHLLDVINARITNALHGVEIDWSQGPDQKPPTPTAAPTLRPSSSSTKATSSPPQLDPAPAGDPDSESSDEYDAGDDLEEGSGEQTDSPSTTADPEEEESTGEEADDDFDSQQESADVDSSQQPTNQAPTETQQTGSGQDSDLTGPKPANELDLDQTNVLITASDQNAQRSSARASGPLQVIQTFSFSLVCALSIVTSLHAAATTATATSHVLRLHR